MTTLMLAGTVLAPPPLEEITLTGWFPKGKSNGTMTSIWSSEIKVTFGDFLPPMITVGVPENPKLCPLIRILDPPVDATEA